MTGMRDQRLPAGVHATAMKQHLLLHRRRIEKMYNRHRALFAESIVAALLPGAEVVPNPAAAWDVEWTVGRRRRYIQVKCSGAYLPAHPDAPPSPPRWDLKMPTKGYAPDFSQIFGPGHHCDVVVLARHEGSKIDRGWTFAVLRPDELDGRFVSARWLSRKGIPLVDPDALPGEIRAALKR